MKQPAFAPTSQRATKYPPTRHDRKKDTPCGHCSEHLNQRATNSSGGFQDERCGVESSLRANHEPPIFLDGSPPSPTSKAWWRGVILAGPCSRLEGATLAIRNHCPLNAPAGVLTCRSGEHNKRGIRLQNSIRFFFFPGGVFGENLSVA